MARGTQDAVQGVQFAGEPLTPALSRCVGILASVPSPAPGGPHARSLPGSCNNAWRRAEAALAADGTDHDIPVTWGQPVHCLRCTGRTHAQLAELPELVVAISLEAIHGTAPKTTGTIGRAATPAWPGQAARLLTDHVIGGMLELEDDIRELRPPQPPPGRGIEGRHVARCGS